MYDANPDFPKIKNKKIGENVFEHMKKGTCL
jgi:hypothetical protein